MKHIAECEKCGGYIDYDTEGYYQDNTHDGECESCGNKVRGDCKEVDDFIHMRGDYAIDSPNYKSF